MSHRCIVLSSWLRTSGISMVRMSLIRWKRYFTVTLWADVSPKQSVCLNTLLLVVIAPLKYVPCKMCHITDAEVHYRAPCYQLSERLCLEAGVSRRQMWGQPIVQSAVTVWAANQKTDLWPWTHGSSTQPRFGRVTEPLTFIEEIMTCSCARSSEGYGGERDTSGHMWQHVEDRVGIQRFDSSGKTKVCVTLETVSAWKQPRGGKQ